MPIVEYQNGNVAYQSPAAAGGQGAYPVWSYPAIIGEAIKEVSVNHRLSVELAAHAALGTLSLVGQHFVNVQCPSFDPAPVSLFLMAVSKSSGGKSNVEQRFLRAVMAFEHKQEEVVEAKMSDYRAELKIWEDDGLRLAKAYRDAEPGSVEAKSLRSQRVQHEKDRPAQPKKWELRYGDGSPAGLRDALVANHAVGILSPDAAPLLNGIAFSQPATLSAYWSGEDRPTGLVSGSRRPVQPRLTISVMVQEDKFAKYMKSRGSDAFGTGLLARFLVAFPQVMDWPNQSTQIEDVPEPKLDLFNNRVAEILNQRLPQPRERLTLKLSDGAKCYWKWFTETIHNELICGDFSEDLKSFFRKIGQHASRLAALFHYFDGASGDISAQAMKAAISVCEWYLWECIRVFKPYAQSRTQSVETPQSLLQWLEEATAEPWRYPKLTQHRYTERDLRNYSSVRHNPQGLENAINLLCSQGEIKVQTGPKGGRIIYYPSWKAPATFSTNAAFPGQAVRSNFNVPVNAAPVPVTPNQYPQAHQMHSNNADSEANSSRREVHTNAEYDGEVDDGESCGCVEFDSDEIQAVKRYVEQSSIEAGLGEVTLSVKLHRG